MGLGLKIETQAVIMVPEGTKVNEHGHITLPNGDIIKTFVSFELNETEDLTSDELSERGISVEYDDREVTECPI